MKKLMSLTLALIMSLALCLPAYAATPQTISDNSSVSPLDYGGGGGRIPPAPSGYTYVGRTEIKGSWVVDSYSMTAGTVTSAVLTCVNPVIGIVSSIVAGELASALGTIAMGDRLDRVTYDYCYSCNDPGIYPYIYYHVYDDYVKTANGSLEFVESRTATEFALLPMST